MHNIKEIIQDAASLPVEERILVIDSLLRTLNAPDREIDSEWAAVASQRFEDIRSGLVKPVPGEQVFSRIRKQFEK